MDPARLREGKERCQSRRSNTRVSVMRTIVTACYVYSGRLWWARQGSNLRPPACKARANRAPGCARGAHPRTMRGAGLCRGVLARGCCYSAATRRERAVDHFGVNSRQWCRTRLGVQVGCGVDVSRGLLWAPRLLYFGAVPSPATLWFLVDLEQSSSRSCYLAVRACCHRPPPVSSR